MKRAQISPFETRWAIVGDARDLSRAFADTWRYAYAGIIPGPSLERMIARRTPKWWEKRAGAGQRILVAEFNGQIAGYCLLGRNRASRAGNEGEIYELYIRPEFHGIGLGRHLFTAACDAMTAHGLRQLVVWSLTRNTIGCRFYEALGGQPYARATTTIGGTDLQQTGYIWQLS